MRVYRAVSLAFAVILGGIAVSETLSAHRQCVAVTGPVGYCCVVLDEDAPHGPGRRGPLRSSRKQARCDLQTLLATAKLPPVRHAARIWCVALSTCTVVAEERFHP
jgi:hypothetical protein